ncbi:MAG: PAS domain-containing protein [Polyangiales bacterium]
MTAPDATDASALTAMTPEQLDALPFGAILLSRDGTILRYNEGESALSGRRPGDVIGKNFFTEVAPCTDVRAFHGTFNELVAHRAINREFEFVFPFETPARVRITMMYEQRSDAVWVLVDRVDAPAG